MNAGTAGGGPPPGAPRPEDIEAEVSHATLMRYLDGELTPSERREVEARLERSTELQRELAVYRTLHGDLSAIRIRERGMHRSVWGAVHRRLSRPIGWLLIVLGMLAWTGFTSYEFVTSQTPTWEKMATSAVIIGILLLFASVIHERWQELATDPYRDIER